MVLIYYLVLYHFIFIFIRIIINFALIITIIEKEFIYLAFIYKTKY